MDAEERLRATFRALEADLETRIQATAGEGKAALLKWMEDYLAALQVEMPLSVKQVLDRGGVVRSFRLESSLLGGGWPNDLSSAVEYFRRLGHQVSYFPELQALPFKGALLFTVLVEPVP